MVLASMVAIVATAVGARERAPGRRRGCRHRRRHIGGVVTGRGGPEAGVWVIAETEDLPTKFSRTVVTDDRGRYVVRISEGKLKRMGARLRPRGLAEGPVAPGAR